MGGIYLEPIFGTPLWAQLSCSSRSLGSGQTLQYSGSGSWVQASDWLTLLPSNPLARERTAPERDGSLPSPLG